jgi:hypothetical protein
MMIAFQPAMTALAHFLAVDIFYHGINYTTVVRKCKYRNYATLVLTYLYCRYYSFET